MPAGVIARLFALPLGWSEPPGWSTVNDPQGLGLTAVLVAKELPFLLWHLVALLARPELAAQVRGWLASGRTDREHLDRIAAMRRRADHHKQLANAAPATGASA